MAQYTHNNRTITGIIQIHRPEWNDLTWTDLPQEDIPPHILTLLFQQFPENHQRNTNTTETITVSWREGNTTYRLTNTNRAIRTARGNRGYVTTPELQPELEQALKKTNVQYQIVTEPTNWGKYPRPVLITTGPKPENWVRYTRCKTCKEPTQLDSGGAICPCNCDNNNKKPNYWKILEYNTHSHTIKIPGINLDTADTTCITHIRDALRNQTLNGVGPEREHQVSEALRLWRQQVLEELHKTA